MTTKYSQTNEEILKHLKDQIAFILNSTSSYDQGFEGEAKRLAIAIRILVNDTTQSISLLAQLGKRNINFYNSAAGTHPNQRNAVNRLTTMRKSQEGGKFSAPLDNLSPARSNDNKIGFERWWRREIMYRDNFGNTFSRRDIIMSVADSDGGAHIDPRLDQAYALLSRFNSLGWKFVANNETNDFPSPIPPSIRQIAHEVIKTLRDEFPNAFQEVLHA